MLNISSYDQGFMEEYIFRFFRDNAMPLPILPDIGVVPVETDALRQRVFSPRHSHQYITNIYAVDGVSEVSAARADAAAAVVPATAR